MTRLDLGFLADIRNTLDSVFDSKAAQVLEALEDYLAEDLWTKELPTLSGHLVALSQAVKELTRYVYYSYGSASLHTAHIIKRQQARRYPEVSNVTPETVDSVDFLTNLVGYYDALFILDFVLTDELNFSALRRASDAFHHRIRASERYAGMLCAGIEADDMFTELLAVEMSRRCILSDYAFVTKHYERIYNRDILEPFAGVAPMIVKYCYVLSLSQRDSNDESYLYGAKTILTLLKYTWLDSVARGSYWGLDFHRLMLLELAYQYTSKADPINAMSVFDDMQADIVLNGVEEIINRVKSRETRLNVASLSLARLCRDG